MLFETDDGRAAQDVFQRLSETLRRTNYKINEQEKKAFTDCSSEIGARLLTWCGGGAAAGYVIARQVPNSTRWGKFISMTAGCYVGTQIGIRGIKERCLERIVALPTPLGIEAAAILRDKAPDSRLLHAVPPMPDGGDGQAVPSMAAVAAMQRAHQQAGVETSAGADFGAGASGRWPAGQEQSGMSIGGVPEQAAPPTGSQTGMEQAARVQPDALLSDIFFDSSAGSSNSSSGGGRQFEEGSGYDHGSEPHGLQTVHRHRRHRRGFASGELDGGTEGQDDGHEGGGGSGMSF